jgi:hypothetical protein
MLPTIKENNEYNYFNEKISFNIILDILNNNIYSISYMPFDIRNNEEIMLEIVKIDGLLIIYGSEKIQNNKTIIIEAILSNKKVLDNSYININNFKDDKDILLTAISQKPILIANFPNDKELVLKAISIDYNIFDYISNNLQKDIDVVLLAVKNGLSLEYIDDNLKYNEYILNYALLNNINNYKYLPNHLKNNYSIIIPALINNKEIINLINKNDPLINLIYEIEYNYDNAYLNLKDIINNIEYVSKTKNYKKLLKLLIKKINKK